MKLLAVIKQDDTGYYFAEVPALPGCVTQGKTLAEVKVNIKEAISGWVAVMNDKVRHSHARKVQVLV